MQIKTILAIGILLAAAGTAQAKVETQTFAPPTLDGQRVDACVKKGGACGQAGADKFCRQSGFQKARKFSVEATAANTVYPGSGATCKSNCKALASVACMKDNAPTFTIAPLKPGDVGEVNN